MSFFSGICHDAIKPSQGCWVVCIFRSAAVPCRAWNQHGFVGFLMRFLLMRCDFVFADGTLGR